MNSKSGTRKFKPKSYLIYLIMRWLYSTPLIKYVLYSKSKTFQINRILNCLLYIGKDHQYILKKLVRNLNLRKLIPEKNINGVEIHSTLNSKSVHFYIIMIISFWHYSGQKIPVVVHDDGTLSSADIKLLQMVIPEIKILRFTKSNPRVYKKIHRYSLLLRCRENPKYIYHMINLIDIFLFSKADKIIYLDSDLLFFRYPAEIIEWISDSNSSDTVFLNDCDSVYTISQSKCKKYFNCSYLPKFNMGILCLYRKYYNPENLEYFFEILKQLKKLSELYRDQTYWMIYVKRYLKKYVRLPKSYLVSLNPQITSDTICCHYVTPVRNKIYEDAIRLIFQIAA